MQCRACNSPSCQSIIPLGELPIANALSPSKDADQTACNLEVMLCCDCGLAQLKDIIHPKELFSEYLYFSSNSQTMLESAQECVEKILNKLPKEPFVVEIASNDGYLLKNYTAKGVSVLGIDPAKNIVDFANKQGIPSLCAFFSEALAKDLADKYPKADIIHANNVFAHVPDINDFIKGLKVLLADDGRCVIEVPYFLELVQNLEFDTIYHEHVYYFALKPLVEAFKRHGMAIEDVERLDIHGGSLRLTVAHEGVVSKPIVGQMIAQEEAFGLFEKATFVAFMSKLETLKSQLHKTLQTITESGRKVAAYGASAKGTTLLNFMDIGPQFLDFVVDRSQHKQGLYTPGTQLPILKPEALVNQNIDFALLLTWNFKDEILEQQRDFRKKNGKFIVPLPNVEVVG